MDDFAKALSQVLARAEDRFVLGRHSIHGQSHWRRVSENGLRMATRNGADPQVVQLFAVLHDCCRESDLIDPDHGPRSCAFAAVVIDEERVDLSEGQFLLLHEAIRDHTHGVRHAEITIGTCWDADRLDIGRVGSIPKTELLSTQAAKDERMIEWAHARSLG